MKLRITIFISLVLAMAAFGLFTQAGAETVIINNYPQATGHFCWGLVGCLIAHAMDEQDRQAELRENSGPHSCNVWNGRRYVQATCAP